MLTNKRTKNDVHVNFLISNELSDYFNHLQLKLKTPTKSQLYREAMWNYLQKMGIITENRTPTMFEPQTREV